MNDLATFINYAELDNVRKVVTVQETQGSGSSASGAWVTLVNIVGRGWLYCVRMQYDPTPGPSTSSFRITVDGGTPITIGSPNSLFLVYMSSGYLAFNLPAFNLRFESSLKVEYAHSTATAYSGTANVTWGSR